MRDRFNFHIQIMDKSQLRKLVNEIFPIFSQRELVEEIVEKGQYMEIPAKTTILSFGSIIKQIPFVLDGSVKLIREEQNGNSIFLYHITKGQSCAMTISSCMRRETSSAKAVTDSDTKLFVLPVEDVYNFGRRYPSWNDFVVSTFNSRFEEFLQLIDKVSFQKIDTRLLNYLSQKSILSKKLEIVTSHQEIANDLATSREVISRLLKQLERKGIVNLGRGKITILESDFLAQQ